MLFLRRLSERIVLERFSFFFPLRNKNASFRRLSTLKKQDNYVPQDQLIKYKILYDNDLKLELKKQNQNFKIAKAKYIKHIYLKK